jgi:hypothetical protein
MGAGIWRIWYGVASEEVEKEESAEGTVERKVVFPIRAFAYAINENSGL